jgi:hypothetical protein
MQEILRPAVGALSAEIVAYGLAYLRQFLLDEGEDQILAKIQLVLVWHTDIMI